MELRHGKRALGALLLLAGACSRSDASEIPHAAPAVQVRLQTLADAPVRDTSEYVAELKSRHSVVLRPQVDGQLVRIFAHSGDVVEAGAPLMQIDAARQRATLASAEASLVSRRVALGFAEVQHQRVQRLHESGAVPPQELDQARASLDGTRADVDAISAQIRESRVQLGYYRIVAPARGVVGDVPVHVGDYVNPSTALTTIDENGQLEAYVYVPVERAGAVGLGLEVQLVDALDAPLASGRVTFVSPQVNPETQAVLVKAGLQNAGSALREAQFVRARVVWSTHPGVMLPAPSVVRLNGATFAYVVEPHGERLVAHQRPVDLGDIDGNAYVVRGGVRAGDRVVVAGVQDLSDGAVVAEAR